MTVGIPVPDIIMKILLVSDKSSSDEVGMDDIVEVYFEEDDEIEKYKLVTSIRGN